MKIEIDFSRKHLKNLNFVAPFYGLGSTASRLQNRYEEAEIP